MKTQTDGIATSNTNTSINNLLAEPTKSAIYNIKNFAEYLQGIVIKYTLLIVKGTSPIESLNARFTILKQHNISKMIYETAMIYIGAVILKHNSKYIPIYSIL